MLRITNLIPSALCRLSYTSMRPQRDAADHLSAPDGMDGEIVTSMRPQRDAADHIDAPPSLEGKDGLQ